jgi:hypothetical protein
MPGLRKILDWVVTIGVALVFVLVFESEVAKPYRIPSSSMEPTLHCAKPGDWCEGRFNDRVIANRLAYRFTNPHRGQIVVFHAPRGRLRDRRHLRQAADRPAGRRRQRDERLRVDQRQAAAETYVDPKLRDSSTTDIRSRSSRRALLLHGRRPGALVRLAHVGHCAALEPDRAGAAHVLAADSFH